MFVPTTGRGLDYRTSGPTSAPPSSGPGSPPPAAGSRCTRSATVNASLLISNGLNVVFVSRQLGHANPKVTLGVYAHLYARADHADTARAALEAGHVGTLGSVQ